jgi:phosphopantetheine--protein transferase-like protein
MKITDTSLFSNLLPPFVAIAEGAAEANQGVLWPAEEVQIAKAVAKRRSEYNAGRTLARQALAALGGPAAPIPAGVDRDPQWPAGFTGSISHSAGYVVAAVARRADAAAIGIDVEQAARFRIELEPQILSPGEIARHLDGLSPDARQACAAATFSAKEAFYKAQYPMTGRRLGFRDVEVELDLAAGTFEVWLITEARRRFAGNMVFVDGRIAAAIWFPPGFRGGT